MHKVEYFLVSLGQLIQAKRSQSMDQTELAARVGLSRSTISNIESGKGTNVDSLCHVLAFLGLLDDFQLLVDSEQGKIDHSLKRKARKPHQPVLDNDF